MRPAVAECECNSSRLLTLIVTHEKNILPFSCASSSSSFALLQPPATDDKNILLCCLETLIVILLLFGAIIMCALWNCWDPSRQKRKPSMCCTKMCNIKRAWSLPGRWKLQEKLKYEIYFSEITSHWFIVSSILFSISLVFSLFILCVMIFISFFVITFVLSLRFIGIIFCRREKIE